MQKNQHALPVVVNEQLCPRYYRLALAAGPKVRSVKPGQFVHIRIADGLEPLFRRPFSVFRADKYLEIFYEPVGKATRLLTTKKPGDVLDVLGPLGNYFTLPPAGTKQVVMIAGGIGVAPFMLLSAALKKRKNLRQVLLYGGRSEENVFDLEMYQQNGCRVFVATDDGSLGKKGRVSVLFDQVDWDPASTFVYTCGPKPMMKAVQEFAKAHGLAGQLSTEEVMACGLGACLGCAVKTQSGYKTACHDGPVFGLGEIIF